MTFQPDYTGIIRAVDKNFRLTSSQMDAVTRRSTALSTGLLVTDLIMGSGGILPGGMYTFFGKEAAAKSTHSYHILDAAVQAGIPLITVWDYEKSMDPTYLQGITEGRLKADDVFGTLDGKGGWAIEPRVRYYDEVLGITFFDSMSSLLRNLPDKRLVGDDWFYVWPNTKANQKTLSGHYNKSLFSKTNEFWIEAPNGNMQALLFVDSWQGMMAEEDEEDNASKGMALEARMFSRQLKRVKSKLRIKSAALIGVNQYRKAPAVQYGCFPYDAQVLLADGTTLSIGHIVDNKLEIDVVSYNRRTGKCEPKPIINWFNNGKAESKDFLSFVLSDKDGVRRRLLRPTPSPLSQQSKSSFHTANHVVSVSPCMYSFSLHAWKSTFTAQQSKSSFQCVPFVIFALSVFEFRHSYTLMVCPTSMLRIACGMFIFYTSYWLWFDQFGLPCLSLGYRLHVAVLCVKRKSVYHNFPIPLSHLFSMEFHAAHQPPFFQ